MAGTVLRGRDVQVSRLVSGAGVHEQGRRTTYLVSSPMDLQDPSRSIQICKTESLRQKLFSQGKGLGGQFYCDLNRN